MFLTELQQLIQQIFPNGKVWVEGTTLFFTDDDIVGPGRIKDTFPDAYLDQLFLKISRQRIGIGTQILNDVIIACQNNGFTHVKCLPTQGGGLSGRSFCLKHGFTKIAGSGIWSKNV